MLLKIFDTSIVLWLSGDDTNAWAKGESPVAHGCWPCSTLSSRRLRASYDQSGLVDLIIDNGRGCQDIPADELNAITSDFMRDKLPESHPVWFVAIGQYGS